MHLLCCIMLHVSHAMLFYKIESMFYNVIMEEEETSQKKKRKIIDYSLCIVCGLENSRKKVS